jgi:hypothetical protein
MNKSQIFRIAQVTEQLKQLQLRGNVSRKVPPSKERLLPMSATVDWMQGKGDVSGAAGIRSDIAKKE